MDERKIATWLANIDSNGASDEEFAETIVLSYMIWKTGNRNYQLTAEDMKNADTAELTGHIKMCLDEILFSEDADPSCWWKVRPKKPEAIWEIRRDGWFEYYGCSSCGHKLQLTIDETPLPNECPCCHKEMATEH